MNKEQCIEILEDLKFMWMKIGTIMTLVFYLKF